MLFWNGETINANHSMIIVASELDDSSERIVQYLSDDYNVNINAIFFNFFKVGNEKILGLLMLGKDWEDCRKYGFTGAGHGKWYSSALKRLNASDRIFAYQKGAGYIGYGEITGPAIMVKNFIVEEEGKPLTDLLLMSAGAKEHLDNPDLSEWAVPVNWIKTFPMNQAKTFKGVFANQNIVCKLRHEETVNFLMREFGISDE